MNRIYKLFSLNVSSCIHIPETIELPENTQADVNVTMGGINLSEYVPQELLKEDFFIFAYKRQQIYLSCPVGVFEMRDGNNITIMPKEGVSETEIRIFLLGSAMGAIQIQRGFTPIHGGAIVSDNKAVIITGVAGAGKSTMTSTLVSLGLPYLTDDVSSVNMHENKLSVYPAYPQRKLIRDACLLLGYDPNNLAVADEKRDKFAIREKQTWHDTPAQIGKILKLVPNYDSDEVCVKEIVGMNKFKLVMQNLYRYHMHLIDNKFPPQDVKNIANIAQSAEIYEVSVPRNSEKIVLYAKQIITKLNLK